MDHFEVVKSQFRKQARHFSDKGANPSNEAYIRWILDSLPAGGNGRALDVAAGTGILSRALAGRFGHVTAVDLSRDMIAQGEAETKRSGIANLDFVEGNAERLPFGKDAFDLVISRFAFHHFPHPAKVLREMKRVCKTGGTVAVIDIVAPDDPALARAYNRHERLRDPSHAVALRRAELERLFRETGLAVDIAETLDVPVDFAKWIALAKPDGPVREEILSGLETELAGGPATGMRPFKRDGALFFRHTYFKAVGRKG